MFLSEWCEFPSAPCLAEKKNWWQLTSRCFWNRARPWHASELVSFLVGLRTYQHPVQYPLFLLDFNVTSVFSTEFRKKMLKYKIFLKIRPVAAELF